MDFQVLLVSISLTTYTALGKGNMPMGKPTSSVVIADADRVSSEERTTSKGVVQATTRHRRIHPSTTQIGLIWITTM